MTNEISNPQLCVLLRNGIEVWLDETKAEKFGQDWVIGLKAAIKLEGRFINTVDITGIFLPEDLKNLKRQKRGDWQCNYGNWHSKNEDCGCYVENQRQKRIDEDEKQKEKDREIIKKVREEMAADLRAQGKEVPPGFLTNF